MNKTILFLLLNLFFQTQSITLKFKPWTFFTYIAGDNSLAPDVNLDINEMKKGANTNVNTLVYSNIKLPSGTKVANKLVITKNKATQVGQDVGLDSGSVVTAKRALTWALTISPSKYVVVDFWDHGDGILNRLRTKRGVCYDDTTGNYLTDKDVKAILEEGVRLRGKKINILCFDACLMGSLEGNVTWADYVDYVVASEQTIPAHGFNYNLVLNYLRTNPNNPSGFASHIVNAYRYTYQKETDDYTLSAVNTSKIKLLAQNVDSIASVLTNLLNLDKDNIIKISLQKSAKATQFFEEVTYLDLSHLFSNMLTNFSKLTGFSNQELLNNLKSLLSKGISLIKEAVISNTAGLADINAHGISIYFPQNYVDPSYAKLDWSEKYPNWLNFLNKYLS